MTHVFYCNFGKMDGWIPGRLTGVKWVPNSLNKPYNKTFINSLYLKFTAIFFLKLKHIYS